eukprot:scaffold5593_cov92-Cylindrotheca_fusiformis.AAC.1
MIHRWILMFPVMARPLCLSYPPSNMQTLLFFTTRIGHLGFSRVGACNGRRLEEEPSGFWSATCSWHLSSQIEVHFNHNDHNRSSPMSPTISSFAAKTPLLSHATATSSKVEDFGRRPDALSGRLGELCKNNGFHASPMLPQLPMNANGDLRPDGARTEFKDFTIRISRLCPKKNLRLRNSYLVDRSSRNNRQFKIPGVKFPHIR